MMDLDPSMVQQYLDQVRDEYGTDADSFFIRLKSQGRQQQLIEDILHVMDCIRSEIRCLDCAKPMRWTSESENNTKIVFSCPYCPRTPKFLGCDLLQSGYQFLRLITTENIQLVSSALNLVLGSSRYISPLLSSSQLNNPIDILCAYHEHEPNAFKFGGDSKSIVIADLHEIDGCRQYPVLIISDTKMVPTRYYLHALRIRDDCPTERSKYICEYLFDELTSVGNMVIKSGSFLVLGPNLQNWITADMYAKGKHNLELVVPFEQLKVLDDVDKTVSVAQNLKEILKEAVIICDSVFAVFKCDHIVSNKSEATLQQQLQLYLTSAIWLRFFANTPFKFLLYHFLNFRMFMSRLKQARES